LSSIEHIHLHFLERIKRRKRKRMIKMIRKRKVKNKKLINMGRIVVVQVGFLKMNCKGFFVIILMFD
jgi:hypothetical protein